MLLQVGDIIETSTADTSYDPEYLCASIYNQQDRKVCEQLGISLLKADPKNRERSP